MKYRNFLKAGSILCFSISLVVYPLVIHAQTQVENILGTQTAMEFRAKALQSECKPLIAKNETPYVLRVEKIGMTNATECFVLSDLADLPEKISPGESVTFGYICFRPHTAVDECTGTLSVVYASENGRITNQIPLHGSGFEDVPVQEIVESSPGAIFRFDSHSAQGGDLLSMVGHDAEFSRSFHFKNESGKIVTINSINFEKRDGKFEIASVIPGSILPMEVTPGAEFSLRIVFHASDRKPSMNVLHISIDDSKEPISYAIRGLQLPFSQMEWNKRNQSAQVREN
ncbi:MAG: hypothetical protein ABI778_07950 [Ignavibacteriota bacterium]